ncbi:MAG TPA: branched-chain amino acid ABC transporter permease [Microthrixaceae bacterium]|nr:branched-chain amino acid ABC transporter permease [Microthrixaceae bacterium]MCB9375473.1 branched-chain amino acid ABC transporter permease [Microthrixaceae bacterium]MCB9400358.1 branched-chain amino acid ABC transporter permease [Microthrixaceae bacterium]MCC6183911.1 branched-chain amino acid ABC transporter permease [Microthrixaceae bacterium]MCO5305789.1 branched-chain amino acid ABC transporter permease [Microthrixaceae bacterium]
MNLGAALVDGLRDMVAVPSVVYALGAIGLNIQFGFAGLLNFGSVASGLVGAYGASIAVDQGLPLWVGVIIGLAAAALLGLLLGLPTLRLRADYLAIATISAAEIIRVIVNSARLQDVTGGPIGLTGGADDFFAVNPIPEGRYGWGSFSFNQNTLWTILVGWTIVIVLCLFVWGLARSPWGRLLKAVREDEDAARSLGKNVFKLKLQAFVLGSVIGGIAGIIFMFDGGFVKPDFFVSQTTFNWYLVVILGGVATVLGPPVGAIVYWFVISVLNSVLTQVIGDGWWIFDTTDTGAIRYVLVGLTIVLLLVFRPQGLLGDKDEAVIGE